MGTAAVSATNAVNTVMADARASTTEEVAGRLGLSASTIRHYKLANRLFSYRHHGRLFFPEWQFSAKPGQTIPFLAEVLAVLPPEAHPQSVAGFFSTPQPDLIIDGQPVSAKRWLESGGDSAPVVALASSLAAGY